MSESTSPPDEQPPESALVEVLEKLELLPAKPGCYLFHDVGGAVIYVGKAKSLRSRVRSYFAASQSDERAYMPWLRKNIGDLSTIVTATEKEAAILEDSLIKEHKPKYNVKLRDDKSYLSLRLASTHDWPRIELVRRPSVERGALLRAVPKCDGGAPNLALSRKTLSLANLLRSRTYHAQAPLHSISNRPLPGPLRARRQPRHVRRRGSKRIAFS